MYDALIAAAKVHAAKVHKTLLECEAFLGTGPRMCAHHQALADMLTEFAAITGTDPVTILPDGGTGKPRN